MGIKVLVGRRAPRDHVRRLGVTLRSTIQQVMGIQLVKGCSLLYSTLGSTYTCWYQSVATPSVAAAQRSNKPYDELKEGIAPVF